MQHMLYVFGLALILVSCGNSNPAEYYGPIQTRPTPTRIKIVPFSASGAPDSRIKVMVIDTGFDTNHKSVPLCNGGHRSYTDNTLYDSHGHGTHISDLIDQYVKDHPRKKFYKSPNGQSILAFAGLQKRPEHKQYCQVICKYYDKNASGMDNLQTMMSCLKQAIAYRVDFINIAGGGAAFAQPEYNLIKQALNQGITIVAAAGNERNDIDRLPYYPASYDPRIVVVGNKEENGKHAVSANWGSKVDVWEVGESVLSALPNGSYGMMTGSSQSCAIRTGKLIRQRLLDKQKQLSPKISK